MGRRVGIISFLHNRNYGSILQAYSLQKTLAELGFNAEHIDYSPDREEKIRNLLTNRNSLSLVLEGIQKRRARVKWANVGASAASFAPFCAERMRLSPVCRNHKALAAQAARYDALVCGSDQIWSPTWLNPAYFLDFAAKGQRKVAYAPSLGVKSLPSPRKQRRIARLVADFDAISVREQEGAELLKQMAPSCNPVVMPDPVCLTTREEWLQLAQKPECGQPYMLCYFLGEKSGNWERATRLANQTGLRVLVAPTTDRACRQKQEVLGGLSPMAWLGYIADASMLCTDSFHAMMFSAILQTPFTVFRRDGENDRVSRNSRVDQLIRELGLSPEGGDIPWEQVSARLSDMRRAGREYLQKTLSEA